MPNYYYQCKSCGDELVKNLKIAERNTPVGQPCRECGELQVVMIVGNTNIVTGVNIKDKRPDGWKDVLKRAHTYAGRHSGVDV